jgi:hypothetical protein
VLALSGQISRQNGHDVESFLVSLLVRVPFETRMLHMDCFYEEA